MVPSRYPALDALPPLQQVIETHGLWAKKALGQNFLFDLNLTRRIARTAGDLSQTTVIEIGPGPGGLTRALLLEGAAHVVAIEKDVRCRPILEEIAAASEGRLTWIEGDALEVDFSSLIKTPRCRIVANLPYYVGTEILVKFLSAPTWPPVWDSLTLMFQKEVAERIVAFPDEEGYGRLSILSHWRTNCSIAFDIHPHAFTPPPKIWSSVVHLTPKLSPIPCEEKKLSRVTQAAFSQRRKMLRSSLKSLWGDSTESILNSVGILPTLRAETLQPEQFIQLANLL